LSPEDNERLQFAKRKMLGNIKVAIVDQNLTIFCADDDFALARTLGFSFR
jgi:hypothetical protein